MLKVTLVIVVALAVSAIGSPASISPTLRSQLLAGKTDVIVTLKSSIKPLLNQFQSRNFASRGEKLTTITNTLKSHAASTQKPLLSFLSKQASEVEIESFWISNKILIKNADIQLVNQLATRKDVAAITENRKYGLINPVSVKTVPKAKNDELTWGLKRIDVQSVWNQGINGTGVRIGGLDTGSRATHESLRNNFAKDYNWFDAVARSPTPIDPHGHGTHITGTIVGTNGIGVAPGAEWVHCRGMDASGGGSESIFLSCGEWFLCPTLPDGTQPNCAKAPILVSNSWGFYGGGNDFMDDVLGAWISGGIAPIFANGNEGPTCGFLRSPGDSVLPVIAVGATDEAEQVSYFSSLGPSYKGDIKPTIAAPGSDVLSAGHYSDSHYSEMSGTSMAAPHVAGVYALVASAEPNLDYFAIRNKLYGGAVHTVESTGYDCGDVIESDYPNNAVGWGRVSASRSISLNIR